MKSEHKIALENVGKSNDKKILWNKYLARTNKGYKFLERCKEHKQTCQRWLDFLEEEVKWHEEDIEKFEDKVDDLQEAIQEYEKEGI